MSTTLPWITSALEELRALEHRHEAGGLDTDSAWRVLVLLARLGQAQSAGREAGIPGNLRVLGERAGKLCGAPDQDELLSELDAQLTGEGEPFGELLDALLAVDDAATVADAQGQRQEALALVRLANAHVSLEPARTAPLGSFAERRLHTLPEDASIGALWDTIVRAAGDAAVEALPPRVPAPSSLSQKRLLERIRAAQKLQIEEDVSESPLVESLFAVAAAEPRSVTEASFEGENVGIFPDPEGQWFVQVELPRGTRPVDKISLHVSAYGRSTEWVLSLQERSRRTAIAKLGTIEEIRARLKADGLAAPPGELRLRVHIALEEAPE